jgi:methionyl-tRNA formyltransferase
MRIVFFGTPHFAVPSLEALLADGAQVVGVVTQPDQPQGRSRSALVPPAVKQAALRHRLPVLQPDRPSGDVFLAALRRSRPDLGVVVAYGHILKPAVLELPARGMINLHASLLPRLRGAAPINWAILRGDTETGVTVMRMEAGLDSGPVLRQAEIGIGSEETAGALTERLAQLGAETLVETVALLRKGALTARLQNPADATFAPKIDRALTRVDWTEDARAVSRRIRAFDPAPGAWTTLDGVNLKLFRARPAREEGAGPPGQVLSVEPVLRVATGRGVVEIAEAQPAGKSRMTAEAWSRGRGVRAGQLFV